MPKYQVAHGSITLSGKSYTGDKKSPGAGESIELDEKTAGPLIRKGVLAPAKSAPKAEEPTKPGGK